MRPERRAEFVTRLDALWQAEVAGPHAATKFVFYVWGRDENEFVAIEPWKDHDVTNATRASALSQRAAGAPIAPCDRPMQGGLLAGMAAGRAVFDRHSAAHPRAADIGGVFA